MEFVPSNDATAGLTEEQIFARMIENRYSFFLMLEGLEKVVGKELDVSHVTGVIDLQFDGKRAADTDEQAIKDAIKSIIETA